MNILLLAPQPFYQDRGTSIAVSLMLKGLSDRGDHVDVITYHEGTEIRYRHVTIHRIINLGFIHHIRPGFSWKKVICDVFMFFRVLQLVCKAHYDVVHAVEESVFMALFLKWFFRIPYVYDMDSSMSQQIIEKYPVLAPLRRILKFFEKVAVRNAEAVMPVCDALARIIEEYRPKKVAVLPDISLLSESEIQK